MPETKFQRLIFALITVIITVPCFVFYCSSYEAGEFTIDIIKNSVIFIPIEFILAYLCEIFIGSPLSVKLALRAMPPQKKFSYDGRNSDNMCNSRNYVSINELFSNNHI